MPKKEFHDNVLALLRERNTAYTIDFIQGIGELIDMNFPSTDDVISALLRIRTKAGRLDRFTPNAAQQQLSANWGARNIVLKARQLGITTYVAARFFVQTITHPGTLSVQVAHDQDAAEEIFRIVHRYLENLPASMRQELRTSRSNVRQIVFPRLDAVAAKDIIEPQKFTEGLGKIVDGVVECLNASVWAKAK
jgi:hypothetical protein